MLNHVTSDLGYLHKRIPLKAIHLQILRSIKYDNMTKGTLSCEQAQERKSILDILCEVSLIT